MDHTKNTLSPSADGNEEHVSFTELRGEDKILDVQLRPQSLSEYIGQNQIRQSLAIFIEAAKQRKEALEHVIFFGPPGLGKTTLAHIIAKEMGVNIRITSGPAMERTGDLAAILTNLSDGDILFIDEIHRLPKILAEALYPAMEDYVFDIILGKGPSARTVRLNLPRFTLVGATTRMSLLSAPLRDRFGNFFHLEFYTEDEIGKILQRSSMILSIPLEEGARNIIAQRTRGIPRIANRILKRVRDYAQVKRGGIMNETVAHEALSSMGIDSIGLDELDRKILKTVIEKFCGGPVGLSTIAASLSEEMETIEEVYEPFLMQLGFLSRTPRGRVATHAAYHHLGLPFQQQNQKSLL